MLDVKNQENYSEILRYLTAIWKENDVRELRLISKSSKKDILSGYFDNPEIAAKAAWQAQKGRFLYITLNPCDPQMKARKEPNILTSVGEGDATPDNNIVRVDYLLIDCDPARPTNTSSSNVQLAKALEMAESIRKKLGTPYIFGMSGNGYHLIYRLLTTETKQRQAFLVLLGKEFDTKEVTVDKTVFNPSRITKILGSWAIKGRNCADYPHRQSHIIEINQDSPVLVLPAIEEKKPAMPKPITQSQNSPKDWSYGEKLDYMRNFLNENGGFNAEKPWKGGTLFLLNCCAFDSSHAGKDAGVLVMPDGPFSYQCFHNSCQNHTWEDFRAILGKPKAEYSQVRGKTCTCGETDLIWQEEDGHYVLTNRDGVKHVCPKRIQAKNETSVATVTTQAQPRKETEKPETIPISEIIRPGEKRPFPIQALPETIKNFIQAKAASICTNEEFVFMGVLGSISVALQGSTVFVNQDWNKENTSLYLAAVGDTGQGKTPALDAGMAPLFEIAKKLQRDHAQAREEYKEKMNEYEEAIASYRKSKGSEEKPEMPEQPIEKVLVVSNATVEALAIAYQASPAIMLYKDELTGWINGFGQYKNGRGDDKEFFLSGWTGTFVKLIRASRKDGISLPERPCLSVIGGIVPENLAKLRQSCEEDGFVERILFVYPEAKQRRYTEIFTPIEVQNSYMNLVRMIYERGTQSFILSEDARKYFSLYYNYCMECREGKSIIAGSLAKFPSQCLRISAILAATYGETTISERVMADAVSIAHWLESQTEKVMGISTVSQEVTAAQKIMDWAERKGKPVVSARDVVIYTRTCKTTAQAKEILAEMVELGLVTWFEFGKKISVDAVDKKAKQASTL